MQLCTDKRHIPGDTVKTIHLLSWRIQHFKRRNKLEINTFLCKLQGEFLEQFNSAQGTRTLSRSHPLTGKGASLQGVWTEKYTAPCFLFIVIQAVNSLIPNATRHTHNLLFQRPDLCYISRSPARLKIKKGGRRGRERERETATQRKTGTFSPPKFSFMKLVLESVEKRGVILETSLWEGRKVWAFEAHAF